MRSGLAASGDLAQKALRQLLGDRRLEIHPDETHGYRLEGFFGTGLNARTPGTLEEYRAFASVVAGARSDRLHTDLDRNVVRLHFRS